MRVIERKLFSKIDGAYFDAQASERRKLNDDKIQIFFQRPDCLLSFAKKKRNSVIRKIIEEDPVWKRPLYTPLSR